MATVARQKMTAGQRASLWRLVGQLARRVGGKDQAEEIMREKCQALTGHHTTKALSVDQANALLKYLNDCVAGEQAYVAKAPHGGREPGTGGQMWLARQLARELWMAECRAKTGGGSVAEELLEERLTAFLQQRTGIAFWPTTREGWNKVIEGLAAMWERKEMTNIDERISSVEGRAVDLTGWERGFLRDFKGYLKKHGKVKSPGALKKFLEIEGKTAKRRVAEGAEN